MTVILGTASGARNVGHNAAIAVGGYVALAGGDLGRAWIYIAGPLAGALVAVALAWTLRGPHSAAASLAAQGGTDGRVETGPGHPDPAQPDA